MCVCVCVRPCVCFYVFVSECAFENVSVGEWVGEGYRVQEFFYLPVCMGVCVCVCVYMFLFKLGCVCVFVYVYMCVCVCVCMFVCM